MVETSAKLGGLERFWLWLVILGTAVAGLGLFLIPNLLVQALGYPGDDQYIFRMGGAANCGYAVGLLVAVRYGTWLQARLVAIAALGAGVANVVAALLSLGDGKLIVYVLLAYGIVAAVGLAWFLRGRGAAPPTTAQIPGRLLAIVAFATVAGFGTGVLALLFPELTGHLAGYKVDNVLFWRLTGADTFGYFVMGIYLLRSRNKYEARPAIVAGTVFNGLSLLATILSVAQGDPLLLPIVVFLTTLVVTGGGVAYLVGAI
jgi:hypothetical protein